MLENISGGGRVRQKYLGNKGLILLLALLEVFVPLSTDLYLPALPGMTEYFNVPISLVNLTLALFFVVFAVGTLFMGPVSDKYGRKPVIMSGLIVYTVASFLCAYSRTIYALILFRVLQALGGSATCAPALALVKDVYEGRKREVILAIVQSMVLLAPAVAPMIGALILKFTSWRGVFLVLAGTGVLALAGTLALEETIRARNTGPLIQTMGRLGVVLQNPGFRNLLLLFSLFGISMLAFIASSSYIYMNGFGLSAQEYSYYYAANAIGLIIGPALYITLSTRFSRRMIITACFSTIATSGFLLCAAGSANPWLFTASLLPASLAGSCMRTPSANLMLEQQREDTGAASSLMMCVGILFGSVGMFLISFDWGNLIMVLGVLNASTGLICACLWLSISGKPYVKRIPEGQMHYAETRRETISPHRE